MLGGGGVVSHPSQLTTGLVIKSVTTSPTLAGERMLFILQVSILSEQTPNWRPKWLTQGQRRPTSCGEKRQRLIRCGLHEPGGIQPEVEQLQQQR